MAGTAARKIQCAHCGLKGEIDGFEGAVHGEKATFGHRGYDPFSGYLHYECPFCREILLVHPMDVFRGRALTGVPRLNSNETGFIGQFLSNIFRELPTVRELKQDLATSRRGGQTHAKGRATIKPQGKSLH